MEHEADNSPAGSGDPLLAALTALANPHRLRILAALTRERQYVSELARQIGISRPLLHMHLRKLEGAGLITGTMELSEDGKAMKYYETADFAFEVSPAAIERLEATLTVTNREDNQWPADSRRLSSGGRCRK